MDVSAGGIGSDLGFCFDGVPPPIRRIFCLFVVVGDESEDEDDRENRADVEILQEHLKELKEVQVLIDKLDFENALSAEEFIQCDHSESTTEMISNEEILKAVLPNDQEKEQEIEEIPLPTITHTEAIRSYDKVLLYLQQKEGNFDSRKDDTKFIKKLKKEALKDQFVSSRQTNLDNFVNV